MKVYHYTIAEPHVFTVVTDANNSYALPPHCTVTPPPPSLPEGKVAAYSTTLGVWTVRDDPNAVKVPTEVSMWKAKSVLALRGCIDQIEHELSLLGEPDATVAKSKWQYAPVIARTDSFVAYMAAKFGWDSGYVDGLFVEAAQLK